MNTFNRKFYLVFSFFLLLLSSEATNAPKQQSTSLSFFLTNTASKAFVDLVMKYEKTIESSVFWKDNDKLLPGYTSCKVLVAKPNTEPIQHEANRIHCEIENKNTTSYKRTQLVVTLEAETLSPTSKLDQDPSFQFQGPFANQFSKILMTEKNRQEEDEIQRQEESNEEGSLLALPEQIPLLRFMDLQQESSILLGEFHEKEPALSCNQKGKNATCEFRWPFLQTQFQKVSLGENALDVMKALCTLRHSKELSGNCPSTWKDSQNHSCFYTGLWVSFESWGAIDTNPKLECRYENTLGAQSLSLDLGSVVTKAWGNRFSRSPSIHIYGAGLKTLYKAFSQYAKTQEENREAKIDESVLPGRAPWGMAGVSLRRYSQDGEFLSSLGCDKQDVSDQYYYQEPDMVFSSIEQYRYSCSIHAE